MESVFNCNAYSRNYISNSWFYKFNQKTMKLISNTDYGIETAEMVVDEKLSIEKAFLLRCKYDQFLKQPLTLGMFAPCNLDGNVLEEPKWVSPEGVKWDEYVKEYQEAKDRVIFNVHLMKGKANHLREIWNDEKYLFTYNESTKLFLTVGSTIESLVKYNLVLTESAKKQIGIS